MKVLRFLFVMVFMSTFFVIPAQAQGAGQYGFVPLVTQASPGTPLEMQARQAFNRLAPQLLAAQKKGTVLAFEPEFSAGLLKVRYAAGAGPSLSAGLRGLDDINAAAAMVPHESSAAPKDNLPMTPAFLLSLYGSCFTATGVGANSHVVGSLRDKTARVVANLSATADSLGNLSACFDYSGPFDTLVPGYKLTFNIYNSGSVLLGTFGTTVPNVNFTAIHKATAVVAGTGPKNKSFSIGWWHPNLDAGESETYVSASGTIHSTGKWSIDLGTTKIRGNDQLKIYVAQDSMFTFQRYVYAPATYCTPGGNYCGLYGFPSQPATLTIVHGGTSHTYTGRFDHFGWFSVSLEDSTGAPIFLKTGDKISGTGIPLYRLPNLTAVPDYVTDVVSGASPANKYTDIWVKNVVNLGWYEVWTKSNPAGAYSADYTLVLTLKSGDPYTFEVFYTDPVTGNQTDKYISVGP